MYMPYPDLAQTCTRDNPQAPNPRRSAEIADTMLLVPLVAAAAAAATVSGQSASPLNGTLRDAAMRHGLLFGSQFKLARASQRCPIYCHQGIKESIIPGLLPFAPNQNSLRAPSPAATVGGKRAAGLQF